MVNISSVGKLLKYICKPTKDDSNQELKEWEIYCIKALLFELKADKYCKCSYKTECKDFPGTPVVKTHLFHCRGEGRFDPWSRNHNPTCHTVQPKKKKKIECKLPPNPSKSIYGK